MDIGWDLQGYYYIHVHSEARYNSMGGLGKSVGIYRYNPRNMHGHSSHPYNHIPGIPSYVEYKAVPSNVGCKGVSSNDGAVWCHIQNIFHAQW